MSYVKSKATIGLGTILAMDTASTTPAVWTTIGEVKTIAQSGRTFATEDTTNMESAKREFIATLADSGTWKIDGSRVATDAGQVAMETAFNGGSLKSFQITLPKAVGQTSAGDVYAFTALIQDLNYNFAVDKSVTFSATLKVSGDIAFTAGT